MSTGFSRSREEYYAKIRLYCVNVCTDYNKTTGEPMPLKKGIDLVLTAMVRERQKIPHSPYETIKRRFNECMEPQFYPGGETPLHWLGMLSINGISDSYYITNPLRLDEETRAKLERWLPQKVEQATLL